MLDIVVTQQMIDDERTVLEAELKSYEKKKAISNIVVTQQTVGFAGDDVSQNRMGNTLAIANFKFNQAIGPTLIQVANAPGTDDVTKAMLSGLGNVFTSIYTGVYKDTELDWKGADGKLYNIDAEQVGEALLAAMLEVGNVIKQTIEG